MFGGCQRAASMFGKLCNGVVAIILATFSTVEMLAPVDGGNLGPMAPPRTARWIDSQRREVAQREAARREGRRVVLS